MKVLELQWYLLSSDTYIYLVVAFKWKIHSNHIHFWIQNINLYYLYQFSMKYLVMCKVYTDVGGIK